MLTFFQYFTFPKIQYFCNFPFKFFIIQVNTLNHFLIVDYLTFFQTKFFLFKVLIPNHQFFLPLIASTLPYIYQIRFKIKFFLGHSVFILNFQ